MEPQVDLKQRIGLNCPFLCCFSERRSSKFSNCEQRQLRHRLLLVVSVWMFPHDKNNPKTETASHQNDGAFDPHESSLGAELTEQRQETEHSRELGIVYSKIESSKAKQT